ncbi:30S ribosomal protein S1, partial [Acinetobacter baumannii]
DLTTILNVGDEVEAMIVNLDRKTRSITLSVRAKDQAEQNDAIQKIQAEGTSASSGTTNLGALLKAKLKNS